MNRSLGWAGVAVVLAGIGLVAFPVVVTGGEALDLEQLLGFLVAPLGAFVVLLAAVAVDPRKTTIPGVFGNEEEPVNPPSEGEPPVGPPRSSPYQSVHCRYCGAVVTADLASCPRCTRARECRTCGRPLGHVLERPTCPTCARAEPFCNCPRLARPAPARLGRRVRALVR